MFFARGWQESVNFVSLPDPGGGWEDFGTPKGFRKIWCKTGLGGSRGAGVPCCKLQSLGHYLGKTMTLWNLIWDNPCRAHTYSTYYSPPFRSSATGPACPVGGGEVGVDLAKLKSSYPRGGIGVMFRSLLSGRNDRALGRAYYEGPL